MSLIITSNERSNNPNTAETFKPYSYQNHLLNTMKIPPNSEVALQSAKIQKRGTVLVNKFNNQFFHYFGAPLGTATHPDLTYATSFPMWGMAGNPTQYLEEGKRSELNVDDFAESIEEGMDYCAFHPSLMKTLTGFGDPQSSFDVTLKNPADFQGYEWESTQSSAKTVQNLAFNFTDISQRRQGAFTHVGGQVTATTRNGFFVQDRRRPLTQDAGEIIFDISGANAGAGTKKPWIVGLSRINYDRYDTGEVWNAPEYFNPDYGDPAVFNRTAGKTFYDVCVARKGDMLHVYQSGINNNYSDPNGAVAQGRRNWDDLVMNEVIYYGAFNMNFATQVDISSGVYSQIKFILQNEEVEIFIGKGGAFTRLCDFTMNKGGGGGKLNVTAPNNQCKWALYPTMSLSNNIGGTLDLTSYEYYNDYPVYDERYIHRYDYWVSLQRKGLTRWGRQLESAFWNDKSDSTSGLAGDGLLTPLKLGVGGVMDAYESILITAPSNLYDPELTQPANSQQYLGFQGLPVARPISIVGAVQKIESAETPDLVSGVSLFVRLNNFTQRSINARKGTISKIVAHLPRFDNSGNESGAMFFEPHEKTYIDLNNTEELTINSFDVDIVYDDETLCEAVSGKTIVIFHIRQKKM